MSSTRNQRKKSNMGLPLMNSTMNKSMASRDDLMQTLKKSL
jgi:hypothetical protein